MISRLNRGPSAWAHRSAVIGACVILIGCGEQGPELAETRGTVTLDGTPLANARVGFSPIVDEGMPARPVIAETDSDGEYVMRYSSSRSGALPGKYRVTVSTFRPPDEDDNGNPVPGTPETVPEVYNLKSTLTADVSVDGPPIDFNLKSDAGPVVQPPADNDAMMEQEQDGGC